ncbi:MAG TPA: sigma-54 dependent transcriptional regulator [Vicinamibacterales bacterium]
MEATSRDFSSISAISAGMGSRNHQQHVRLIGKSPQIQALQVEIDRVARSDAKVLITGESGVGKEIVSRSIHYGSPRANMTFEPVNCAGLPETLLESELFGHVKGSFTGAYRDKPGKLESAHMGTVFLDEIGEMTLRMQGLLLRFLETGEIQRVGADGGARHVNVRVIGATHRNLREMIAQGTFREDLYYRLNVIQINVPPLRERREDIPELVTHFLNKFVVANRSPITGVSPDAMKALVAYSWPGNVRELENLIERMVVAVQHDTIELHDLPSEVRAQDNVAFRPRRERRRTVADDLYTRLTEQRESFWSTVYPMYMAREITRAHVRDVVRRGLEEARGNYKIVARLFNMETREYKRFLNFLRKHDCQLPFKEYR